MARKNRKIFNSLANSYENAWAKPGPAREKVKKIARMLGLKKGMKVLEPGCGRGDFSPFILEKIGASGKLLCVDVAEKMAACAKKAMKSRPNVKVVTACASRTGARESSFDAVVCFNSFPHFYPKEKFIREFYRVLKPGGMLAVAHDIRRTRLNSLHRKFGFYMKKHSLPAAGTLKKMLETAGFGISDVFQNGVFLMRAFKKRSCVI